MKKLNKWLMILIEIKVHITWTSIVEFIILNEENFVKIQSIIFYEN